MPEVTDIHQPETIHPDEQLQNLQEHALSVLEGEDYLSRDEKGHVMFDIDKFKSNFKTKNYFEYLKPRLGALATSSAYGGGKWISTLAHTFKDINGYSPQDYDRLVKGEEVEAKPLFYLPKNAQEAVAPEAIKQTDFYLGLWEVGSVPQLPQEYPTLEDGNRSGVLTREAITAALIFHPKFGDAERREDGKLYVRFNPQNGDEDKRPISAGFFRSWGYAGAPRDPAAREIDRNNGSLLVDSPVDFFQRYCPHLVENGVINPHEDFKVSHKYDTLGEQDHSIRAKGNAWIDGINYTLGAEYADGKHSAIKISDRLVGIVSKTDDGGLKLIKVFEKIAGRDQLPQDGQIDSARDSSSKQTSIRKSDITFLDPSIVEGLGEGESVLISDFEDFLSFSQRVGKEARFNVLNLTLKEKALATRMYQEHGEDPRMWEFVKRYGLNGLRSMMAVEEANANAQMIWEIGEEMDCTKLFDDISDIVAKVTAYQESVRGSLPEEEMMQADKVAHTIMAFTSDALLSLGPVVRSDPSVKGKIDVADVVSTLRSFRGRVDGMYGKKFGIRTDDDLYQKILNVYKGEGSDPHVDAVALQILKKSWLEQANTADKSAIQHVYEASDSFYAKNEELFSSASETTGDTTKELDHFRQYLIQRELSHKPVTGIVLDMGCGDGERITRPMANALQGQAHVVGIDRMLAAKKSEENMSFVQGDFTQIPLADNSVDLVTAHWSVINDLASRKLQLESFEELARVLKEGGEFYFDVPYLEGGEGSWEEAAKEFHQEHPDQPYGMIHATFPNGRNKEFYIYPEKELRALMEQVGFTISQAEGWRTESGKPRKTFIARLDQKVTPQALAA